MILVNAVISKLRVRLKQKVASNSTFTPIIDQTSHTNGGSDPPMWRGSRTQENGPVAGFAPAILINVSTVALLEKKSH